MLSTKYYSQYLRRAGALPPPGTLLCTLYNGGGRPLATAVGREQFLVEGAEWGGGAGSGGSFWKISTAED